MAQSQVIDWLFENGYRMYPMTEFSGRVANSGYAITNNVILDLNLYVPGYPIVSEVQLISISISGTTATFTFSGSNVFTVTNINTISYPYQVARLGNGSVMAVGADLANIPSGTHIFPALYVEPALVYELSNAWLGVTQLSVSPQFESNTGDTPYYKPVLPLVTASSSTLVGDITLLAGFNFNISVSGNTIDLSVIPGSGIPLTCDDEFIASEYKDCGSIISYINGVPPDSSGTFTITGGTNIVIADGDNEANFEDAIDTTATSGILANEHTIFVGMTFALDDLCAPMLLIPPTK